MPYPGKGLVPFEPYPYQLEVLQLLKKPETKRLLVLKARQIGFTTLIAGYATWTAMFVPHSLILYISIKEADAQDVVDKMRTAGIAGLPRWMQERCGIRGEKKGSITFGNESIIQASQSMSDPARGKTVTLLVLDEWAFFNRPELAWASAAPAADVGGRVIMMSTAAAGNAFYEQQWEAANAGKNDFHPMFFPWSVVTTRDENWLNQKNREMNEIQRKAEFPSTPTEAFSKSGSRVFSAQDIARLPHPTPGLTGTITATPTETTFNHTTLQGDKPEVELWLEPTPNTNYVIGADPSSGGEGRDPASAHILTRQGQVAGTLYGEFPPREFADRLVALARHYNKALILVESNGGWGQAVGDRINEVGYRNVYRKRNMKKDGTTDIEATIGFHTNEANKQKLMTTLGEALFDEVLDLKCAATVKELENYSYLGGKKLGAPPPLTDDRVMSLAFALHACGYASKGFNTLSNTKTEWRWNQWGRLLDKAKQERQQHQTAQQNENDTSFAARVLQHQPQHTQQEPIYADL